MSTRSADLRRAPRSESDESDPPPIKATDDRGTPNDNKQNPTLPHKPVPSNSNDPRSNHLVNKSVDCCWASKSYPYTCSPTGSRTISDGGCHGVEWVGSETSPSETRRSVWSH